MLKPGASVRLQWNGYPQVPQNMSGAHGTVIRKQRSLWLVELHDGWANKDGSRVRMSVREDQLILHRATGQRKPLRIRWDGPVTKRGTLGMKPAHVRTGVCAGVRVEVEASHYSGQTWCVSLRVGDVVVKNSDWMTVEGGARAALSRAAELARSIVASRKT